MFGIVIYASIIERQAPVRLGLLNTYKSLFSLDDSLGYIKTRKEILEHELYSDFMQKIYKGTD
jgi:hypothetical protein